MIRVTKPGGYIYITFPVSRLHTEEWSDGTGYPGQPINDKKHFFQYRFSSKDIKEIRDEITVSGSKIKHEDIFWEKINGTYDQMLLKLNKSYVYPIYILRNIMLNIYYGLTMFRLNPSSDFTESKLFGNIHYIIKKND